MHNIIAVKDPSVVSYNGRWHVYMSTADSGGSYGTATINFTDWSQANAVLRRQCLHLLRIDDRLGVRRAAGGASRRPVPLAHPTHPLRDGAACGFKIQKAPLADPSSEREPGIRGCRRWRGGLGFGMVGSVVCSLLGRSPEAIRLQPGGQAAVAFAAAAFCIAPLDLPAGA